MAFRKTGDSSHLGILALPQDEVVRADASEIASRIRGRNLTAEEAEEIKRAADAASMTDRHLRNQK